MARKPAKSRGRRGAGVIASPVHYTFRPRDVEWSAGRLGLVLATAWQKRRWPNRHRIERADGEHNCSRAIYEPQ